MLILALLLAFLSLPAVHVVILHQALHCAIVSMCQLHIGAVLIAFAALDLQVSRLAQRQK